MNMKRMIAGVVSVLLILSLTACGGRKLQVQFDVNGATAVEPPASIEASAGKTYGQLPVMEQGVREGYSFAGWYLNKACTGEAVTADTKVSQTDDHTLYAKWVGVSSVVSFDLQGGSVSGSAEIPEQTVNYGQAYHMLLKIANPQKDNLRFCGWYYDAEGTDGPVDATTTVSKTHDHTLYAKWMAYEDYYDFNDVMHLADFDNFGNSVEMKIVERNGNKMLQLTNRDGKAETKNIVLHSLFQAGTKVRVTVRFDGTASENTKMSLMCYGATGYGDPITSGSSGAMVTEEYRKWYEGNGVSATYATGQWQYSDGSNEDGATIEYTVMEDCYGIAFLVTFAAEGAEASDAIPAVYLDDIQITFP